VSVMQIGPPHPLHRLIFDRVIEKGGRFGDTANVTKLHRLIFDRVIEKGGRFGRGRLNQWAHWARAQGPRFFFFLRGPQLAVVK